MIDTIVAVKSIPKILDIAEFINGVSGNNAILNISLALARDTKESNK